MTVRAIARWGTRIPRWLLWAAGAGLVLFHADLLAERLGDGSLVEPRVALRWLATGLLAVWVFELRRRGLDPFRGRGAIAFWAMIVLLHAVPGAPLAPVVAWSVEAATSAPVTAGLLLLLAARLVAAAVPCAACAPGRRAATRFARPLDPAIAAALAPRAPPS